MPAFSPVDIKRRSQRFVRTRPVSQVTGALVCFGLLWSAGACGENQEADRQNDGRGSGGARSGTGGALSGSGGSPGECNQDLSPGDGGAIYIPNCPEWIGEPTSLGESAPEDQLGPLNVNCSAGGHGGDGGESSSSERPLLEKLCKTAIALHDQPLIECLHETLSSPCSPEHESEVRDCLYALKPCRPNETQCTELIQECPELNESLCFWGMRTAEEYGRADEVRQCMAAKPSGEACDDAFLRCQWGL